MRAFAGGLSAEASGRIMGVAITFGCDPRKCLPLPVFATTRFPSLFVSMERQARYRRAYPPPASVGFAMQLYGAWLWSPQKWNTTPRHV
jgi:hypothetical protein